jgi:radical SAM protein with 4Fe4S-binding SPASM domain
METIPRQLMLDVELTSVCNARCNFCPQSWNGVKRTKPYMTKELLDTLIGRINELQAQQIATYGKAGVSIGFVSMGETLLKKDLLFYALKMLPANVSTILITNGFYMDEDFLANPYVQKRIGRINVSISGWGESYEAVYGISFETVINNLLLAQAHYPQRLTVTIVNAPETPKRDNEKLSAFLTHKNIAHSFPRLHSRGGHYKHPDAFPGATLPFSSCNIFQKIGFIASDGNLLSCCHDVKTENIIGNLYTDSLLDIQQRKKKIFEKGIGFDICRNCTDFSLQESQFGSVSRKMDAVKPEEIKIITQSDTLALKFFRLFSVRVLKICNQTTRL